MAGRVRLRDELDTVGGGWVGGLAAREALRRLDAATVPCSLVYSGRDLFEDPQVKARENIVAVPSPLGGLLHMAGIGPQLSLTPGAVDSAGPRGGGAHHGEGYAGPRAPSRQ